MNNSTEQIFIVNPAENQSLNKVIELPTTSEVNLENVEDFANVCRTCATITEFVVPIFMGEGLQNNLADKIHKHLPIQVSENDLLPRVVCYQCASTLLAWHELVQCSVQADTALRTRLAVILSKKNNTNHEQSNSEAEVKEKSVVKFDVANVKAILSEHFQLSAVDLENSGLEFICEKCNDQISISSVDSFLDHLQSQHYIEIKDEYGAETFIKEYTSIIETLIAEEQTSDAESEKETCIKIPRLHCPFCECSFSSKSRLTCHLNQHIDVCIENGIQCCEEIYYDNDHFAAHLQECHVKCSIDNSFVCQSCGYIAEDSGDLQAHISVQHKSETTDGKAKEKIDSDKCQKYIPAVCPKCNRTFSNKYNMLVHMKSHSESSKKYQCDRCSKSYKSVSNLKTHQKVAHEGILSFLCSHCGEAFPSRTARDVHNRIHTGARPYTCQYCNKSYRAKNTLDRHVEMHLDIRKYECHLCTKRFRKRTHLNYHLNTHKKKAAAY